MSKNSNQALTKTESKVDSNGEKPKYYRGHGVLTDEERIEACKMYASFSTFSDIRDYFKEKGKKIHLNSIAEMTTTKRWSPLIQQLRAQFTQGIMEEPLYNKRVRLRVLERALELAEVECNTRDMIDIVDSAREEAEPRNDRFSLQFNQLNMISDSELLETISRLEDKVNHHKKEIIDARETRETVEGSSQL